MANNVFDEILWIISVIVLCYIWLVCLNDAVHRNGPIRNYNVQEIHRRQNVIFLNPSFASPRGNSNYIARPTPSISASSAENDISVGILQLQESLREKEGDALDESIIEAQKLVLSSKLKSFKKPYQYFDSDEQNSSLIIGVDATPATQAGYCVNLKEKWLYFYAIKRNDFPFTLEEECDSSEFEMKNMMFALLLWQDLILKYRSFRIYTDNLAILQRTGNKHGTRAYQLLWHYKNCKGISIKDEKNMHVNKYRNLKNFAIYLRPADDLSRWRINEAVAFLSEYYGIDKVSVEGTQLRHLKTIRRGASVNRFWYTPTTRYKKYVNEAKEKINRHICYRDGCNVKIC